jgi:hypothetical protein
MDGDTLRWVLRKVLRMGGACSCPSWAVVLALFRLGVVDILSCQLKTISGIVVLHCWFYVTCGTKTTKGQARVLEWLNL